MKPPAFPFYVDDFLGGTMHFANDEVGLYLRLLCVQWSTGSLPDDDTELARYGRGRTPLVRVKAKFRKCDDGLLRNDRLEAERQKQIEYRESRSLNGKLGGRPPKAHGKHMVSQEEPKPEAKKSLPVSPFQLPVSVNTETPLPPEGDQMKNRSPVKIDLMTKARIVLGHLNEATGRMGSSRYAEIDTHLKPISQRLLEVGEDVDGTRAMITRQIANWSDTEMSEYLRPKTLFAKTNFHEYFANKDLPPKRHGSGGVSAKPNGNHTAHGGPLGGANRNEFVGGASAEQRSAEDAKWTAEQNRRADAGEIF